MEEPNMTLYFVSYFMWLKYIFLMLSSEDRLAAFKKRAGENVLMIERTYKGDGENMYNEEIYNVHSTKFRFIISMIKSKTMELAWHIARVRTQGRRKGKVKVRVKSLCMP